MSDVCQDLETVEDCGLSVKQEIAMLALMEGHTQRRAAEIAGVTEFTVSRWMDDDTMFYQTFVARKADIWKRYEARICALTDKALAAIEWALNSEGYHSEGSGWRVADQLRAAELVLRMSGLLRTSTRVTAFGGAQVNVGDRQINTTGDIQA